MIESNRLNNNQIFLKKLKLQFQNYFDYDIYERWISKIDLFSLSSKEIIFSTSSKFLRDWITREYLPIIKDSVQSINPNINLFSIIFIPKEDIINNIDTENNKEADKKAGKKVVNLTKYKNIFTFGTDLNEKFTFDNLVVGNFNKLAVGSANIISSNKKQSFDSESVNPLFIYGAVGLGKTHIGQSVAWKIKNEDPNINVIHLSAERFVHHFVKSIREKTIMDFKEKFKNIDVLIIDDLQFLAKKQGTQEEILHIINNLIGEKKRIILICDQCPGDINDVSEKFRSKISSGMIVDVKSPNYQDRINILQKKISALDIELDPKILDLIATKITSNVRDLEGAIKKIAANHIIMGEEITLKNVQNLLMDFFRTNSGSLNIGTIQKEVAKFFNIKISDLKSSCRNIKFARPRQIAMFLAKNLTNVNLVEIGKEFGNKKHATVIYACKKIEELTMDDKELLSNIKEIEYIINNH
jgi:chromosomal replication initiator protein